MLIKSFEAAAPPLLGGAAFLRRVRQAPDACVVSEEARGREDENHSQHDRLARAIGQELDQDQPESDGPEDDPPLQRACGAAKPKA